MEVAVWAVAIILFLYLISRMISAGRDARELSSLVEEGASRIAAPHVDLSRVPERFVVFDLETTGLDPIRHEIIEISAIRVNRDSDLHDTFQSLVKPQRRISKRITQINGISQAMVEREGKPLEDVLRDFAEFIGDLPLISFNADFDMAFLLRSAKRHEIVIRNRPSCALKLARRAWPGRETYRLCDLAKDGNLSGEGAHRALEDCKRTVIVYTAAMSKLGQS